MTTCSRAPGGQRAELSLNAGGVASGLPGCRQALAGEGLELLCVGQAAHLCQQEAVDEKHVVPEADQLHVLQDPGTPVAHARLWHRHAPRWSAADLARLAEHRCCRHCHRFCDHGGVGGRDPSWWGVGADHQRRAVPAQWYLIAGQRNPRSGQQRDTAERLTAAQAEFQPVAYIPVRNSGVNRGPHRPGQRQGLGRILSWPVGSGSSAREVARGAAAGWDLTMGRERVRWMSSPRRGVRSAGGK